MPHFGIYNPYRKFIWEWWKHYLDWKTYFYAAKYFIQRGRRGWADCDIWGLDDYLNEWMPAALELLRNRKHGVPGTMFETCSNSGNPSDEEFARAIQKWDSIMLDMAEGFKAAKRLGEGLYEEELGEYNSSDSRYEKAKKLQGRDQTLMKKGFALFVEHYQALWD